MVDCCVAGRGPAGAVLGLVLARAGLDVVVFEKHAAAGEADRAGGAAA
jgi:flavin-dependent dehydrogenase